MYIYIYVHTYIHTYVYAVHSRSSTNPFHPPQFPSIIVLMNFQLIHQIQYNPSYWK